MPSILHHATATEWTFKGGRNGDVTALIRRLEFGDYNRPQVWFRVVTFHGRELVGYVRTLEDAATLAWEYSCALDSWRHEHAARRDESEQMPPAADLARAYRQAMDVRRLHERDKQLGRNRERGH